MVDGATGERLDAKKLAARIKKNPNYKSSMTVEIYPVIQEKEQTLSDNNLLMN